VKITRGSKHFLQKCFVAKKINIFFYNGILGGAILSPPKLKGLKQSLAGLMWPVGCTLAMSGLVVKAGNS
jgi:hypothetical protein